MDHAESTAESTLNAQTECVSVNQGLKTVTDQRLWDAKSTPKQTRTIADHAASTVESTLSAQVECVNVSQDLLIVILIKVMAAICLLEVIKVFSSILIKTLSLMDVIIASLLRIPIKQTAI